jgi:cell division protein FtsN
MDQDTSNSPPGKASWREKLGLGAGAKAMPKISSEFKAARTNLNAEPKAQKEERPEPAEKAERVERPKPQPVARPAPMAPRPQPQAKQQAASPLAERLKAQRQAAEKLAEQRILAARSARAEARPADKPKFTFAEEEIAQAKREVPVEPKRDFPPAFVSRPAANNAPKPPPAASPPAAPPPLVPPRPSLGGERPIAPQPSENRSPPPGPNLSPRYQGAASQPTGYRPLDPPNYQTRQQAPAPPPRPPSLGNGAYTEPRGAPPRGYDSYRRRAGAEPAEADETAYGGRSTRRTTRPQPAARSRAPAPAYDEDLGDVFEDEAPARRRASAQDYHRAYRDYDEGYGQEERRRSSGPWLIALALFVVAVLATAGWYYLYFMKPSQVTSAEVPVIAAPEKPAKTEPEPAQPSGSTLGTSGSQGSLESAPERRKQIYDRVLGEEAIEGNQMVPTQEQPQQVEPAGDQSQQGTLPQPNVQGKTGAGSSQSTEPLPLPLPPPPGGTSDQQGSLTTATSQQTAALSASGDHPQPVAQPASADDVIAPIPGEADADTAVKKVEQAPAPPPPVEKPAKQPAAEKVEAKALDEPPPAKVEETAPPVKPKARATKAESKKKVEKIGEPEPMVLVPSQDAASQGAATTQPVAMPNQIAASDAQPEKRSGSFFDFLRKGSKKQLTGKRDDQSNFSNPNLVNAGPKPLTEQPPAAQEQVASISPDEQAQPLPMPAPEAAEPKPQGGGFLAQLASYRSEAEAMAEFDRLRTKYGDVVGGLPPRVTKASVSGTTRYRLGVGPVGTREAAARICNSLIAAGERDCLVRGN